MKPAHVTGIAVLSAVAGGVAGWGIAQRGENMAARNAAAGPSPAAASRTVAGHPLADHRLTQPDQRLGGERARALKDPAYLHDLMRQYGAAKDLDQRGAVIAILSSVQNDQVLRFASQLASAGDARQRADGITLLTSFPADRAEVREAIAGRLRDERDPALTAQLLRSMTATQVATEDAAPIVAELARLRASTDPAIRAASVLQSLQWDKAGDSTETLHHALLDPTREVREAGIAGVQMTGIRTPLVRDALLEIASNAETPHGARQSAVLALQGFALNRDEYAIYRQAAEALPKD